MSKFRINPTKAKAKAEDMERIRKEMAEIEGQIDGIISDFYLEGGAADLIRDRLRMNLRVTYTLEGRLDQYALALSEIADLYEKTDNTVAGNGEERQECHSAPREINVILERIRSLYNLRGIRESTFYSADPVDISNGNYIYEKTFLNYDTVLPMHLRLFYNVMEDHESALGRGWIHNFAVSLFLEDGAVGILTEDGSNRIFAETETGYTCGDCDFGTLVKTEEGYLWTDREGTDFLFDEEGRLLRQSRPGGEEILLSYEEDLLREASHRDGIIFTFTYENDRLRAVKDQAGRQVSFTYEKGKLVSVKDPEGSRTAYGYDVAGNLCQITSPSGTRALYNTFDEKRRTIRQIFADGGTVSYEYRDKEKQIVMTRQNGSPVTYVHDDRDRNIRTLYPGGEESFTYNEADQLTSRRDPLGHVTSYSYDERGRLVRATNPEGVVTSFAYTEGGQLREVSLNGTILGRAKYDALGRQVLYVNALGGKQEFHYEAGRLTETVHEDGSRTRLTYDKRGLVTAVEDPRNGRTEYTYDACRRVIRSRDALGRITSYCYDRDDRIISVTNPAGDERAYDYDRRGNLVLIRDYDGAETRMTYNSLNLLSGLTDPEGGRTSYAYDSMWQVSRREDPDGSLTEYEYDTESRPVLIRTAQGEEKAFYDAAGRLVMRTDRDGSIWSFTHDACGRVISATDPMGHVRTAAYDERGNVISIDYGDGICEYASFDALDRQTSFTDKTGYTRSIDYDSLGNVSRVSDSEGDLERYTYYPGGLMKTSWTRAEGSQAFFYDAVGKVVRMESDRTGTWEFTYDLLDRVTRVSRNGVTAESYEYDAAGRVTAVTDGLGNRTAFTYSPAGNLLETRDPEGRKVTCAYDACRRLVKVIREEGEDFAAVEDFNRSQTCQGPLLSTYSWDSAGNLLSETSPEGGTTTYSYDALSRMIGRMDADGNITSFAYNADGTRDMVVLSDGRSIRCTYNSLQQLTKINDWLGTMEIEYDPEGRPVRTRDQEGREVRYCWNGRGDCTAVIYPDGQKASYTYSPEGRLTRSEAGGKKFSYSYFENGALKERTMEGGTGTAYAYDDLGRIRTLTHLQAGRPFHTSLYCYDACHRKSRIEERTPEGPERVRNFSYTPAGLLSCVTENERERERYFYDGFGNRTRAILDGRRIDFFYDSQGHLVKDESAGRIRQYAYDGRGNLKEMTLDGEMALRLHFDGMDRLTRVLTPLVEASYVYNGLDVRVGRTISGPSGEVRESYVCDYGREEGRLLQRLGGSGNTNLFWDGNFLASRDREGTRAFFSTARMDPLAEASEGGTLRVREPQTFGMPVRSGDLFGFTGYRPDPVTGFLHAGAREYDPESGRFISRDPEAGSVAFPVTLNLYAYCGGDPVNKTDPTGRVAAWLAAGIVGAVANMAVKGATDIYKSLKKGKWVGGSWESYVGSAAGGFVGGVTLITAGGFGPGAVAAAGAAVSSVETLVTGGLSMAFGEKGYRKEDGYTFGSLMGDTLISGAEGAISGFVFGTAAKHLRIPGITAGRGSYAAVWKQVVTKAQRNIIHNITWRTIGKGIIAFGLIRSLDQVLQEMIEDVKGFIKDNVEDFLRKFFSQSVCSTAGAMAGMRDIMAFGNGICPVA